MNNRQIRYFIRHNVIFYSIIIVLMILVIWGFVEIIMIGVKNTEIYNNHICQDIYGLDENCNEKNN